MKRGIIVFCLILLAVLGGTECALGTTSQTFGEPTHAAYRGTIYTPFSVLLPSDYAAPSDNASTHKKSRVRKSQVVFDTDGWTESADARKSTQNTPGTPIGSPWVMMLFCLLFTLYKRPKKFLPGLLFIPLHVSATTVSVQLANSAIRSSESVIATPTLTDPPLSGGIFVCWDLYYDRECTHLVPDVTFRGNPTPSSHNSVSFTAPAPGTYFLKTEVRNSEAPCAVSAVCEEISTVQVFPDIDAVLTRGLQRAGRLLPLSDKTENCTISGVMDFYKDTINDASLSPYQRYNYFLSLPFDVRVGDIYGFGNYGQHWLIEYYDGLGRAQNGYWADSEPNWKRIGDTDSVLHAYQGYILKLNSIRMQADRTDVWSNDADVVSLYFPALSTVSLALENETIPALSEAYRCTIDQSATLGAEGDRTIKDSFWRCLGAPPSSAYHTTDISFLYEWHLHDNSLSVVDARDYNFAPMHAYLLQQQAPVIWRTSAPASLAPRAISPDTDIRLRLDLLKDTVQQDHTFIRLTEDGNADSGFTFGEDLVKELNAGSNIYSLIGYERIAGNSLPFSNQPVSIPIGVQIAADGVYTFSLPAPPTAVSVTLRDKTDSTQILLNTSDYAVCLTAGSTDTRFEIEIAPVSQIATGVDNAQFTMHNSQSVRKMLIDGRLYIVRDGKTYDAQGIQIAH